MTAHFLSLRISTFVRIVSPFLSRGLGKDDYFHQRASVCELSSDLIAVGYQRCPAPMQTRVMKTEHAAFNVRLMLARISHHGIGR